MQNKANYVLSNAFCFFPIIKLMGEVSSITVIFSPKHVIAERSRYVVVSKTNVLSFELGTEKCAYDVLYVAAILV